MKVPFPRAIGIRASRCYTFLWLETKNPRFCPGNHPEYTPKKPFFGPFFSPFIKSKPPFVKSNLPFVK